MSNVKILCQYIKDLSFELPNSPNVFLNQTNQAPDIGISVDLDAKKIAEEEIYEVTLKITADANDKEEEKVFIAEISYSGVFALEGVEKESLEQILLIYCPNLLFPYVRKIVSNLTIDGNFPPLMLQPIDFADLYAKKKGEEKNNLNA